MVSNSMWLHPTSADSLSTQDRFLLLATPSFSVYSPATSVSVNGGPKSGARSSNIVSVLYQQLANRKDFQWTVSPACHTSVICTDFRFLVDTLLAGQRAPDMAEDFHHCNVEHDADKDGQTRTDSNNIGNIETGVGFRASLDGCDGIREPGGIEGCHIDHG
jgi:hypothetical protein